jgi:hypothetical protein
MAAEGIKLPWWWESGTISTNLDVIWGMSVHVEWSCGTGWEADDREQNDGLPLTG